MGKKKGKKAIDIEELKRRQAEENANIEDAEYVDEKGKKHSRRDELHVGSKDAIEMRIQRLFRTTEELRYRTAAAKFKKEALEPEPASEDDIKRLKAAAVDAIHAFAEKAGLDKKHCEDVIEMLNGAAPKDAVKIAERIQDEISKSEKLKTYRNWWERGLNGEGWYKSDKDEYEMDPLYGLPMDLEAAKELGNIHRKYSHVPGGDDGWNGYWGTMVPNTYEEERMAKEAELRAQASYARFINSAFGF